MYSNSPKTGLAQKKKKQAIRRLSQTGKKRVYGNTATGTRSAGRGGHSSQQRSHSQPLSSQSAGDNPFLKGLSGAKQDTLMGMQAEDNPFLRGLAQGSEKPLPLSNKSAVTSGGQSQNPKHGASVPSFIIHGPNHNPTNQKQDMNSFHPTSELPLSSSARISVQLTQSDGKSKDQSTSVVESEASVRPRVPSYSEVAKAHYQRKGNKSNTASLSSGYENLKTLHIKGIPDELNNSEVLRTHFAKFGSVKLLKCFPIRKYATAEFATREEAIRAKKAGKTISSDHSPVMIFWHASRQAAPTRPQDSSITSQPSVGPDINKDLSNPPGDAIEEIPLSQQPVLKKASVWSRLGPEKTQTDDEWRPEQTEGGEEDEDQDEGVCEGADFLKELGNKVTGDEMDTIARNVDHPYFLRSLMQPDIQKESVSGSQTQPHKTSTVLATSLLDSHQLYHIPQPDVPLLPHTQGNSTVECYEVLDARDQAIRKGMVKQTVLSEARAMVGTCPDMCPEKERYRREDTRRLSWFEVCRPSTTGKPKVDHAKAIKEYSGSAADKEEPLPHDLRPLSILQMTMDYLVTTVMDDYQERPADWYDFVWNRTRGIRKDITLQHLCTVESAELTEKCARFHILCSHLLCEEDTTTFDPRMNNENLNKCLLSLKEFYRDLRIEKGVYCPNEAEFCCYDILLHLADGNVLNLVTQYSESVRDTTVVRFAVNVALSFESNNFVKFFKLVRTTTYLNACILHRYFNVVRMRALKVLNRSLTFPKRPTNFPLADLSRMLAFENNEKAAEFCELRCGLSVPLSRRLVQFVRGGVSEGEQALPITRSSHLVEYKNKNSLGEVVNGKPLPPLFSHTPFSSFSSQAHPPNLITPTPIQAPPSPPPKPSYTEEDLTSAMESVVCEAVSAGIQEVISECLREETQLLSEVHTSVCHTIQEGLLKEVVCGESQEIAQKCVLEALEVKSIKDELAECVVKDTMEAVLKAAVQDIAQNIHWDCVLNAAACDEAAAHLTGELVEECVCDDVRAMCSETLRQLKQEKQQQLEVIRQQCILQRTHKYWLRWRGALKVREHVRECVSDIPPLPPLMSLPQQLDMLCPLEKRRRIEVMTSFKTAERLEESRREREKQRNEFYAPLNLPLILQDSLLAYHTPYPHTQHTPHTPHIPHIYWKLTFVYPPSNSLSTTDSRTIQWFYKKLRTGTDFSMPSQSSEQVAAYSVSVGGASPLNPLPVRKLNVAVQGVCSTWGGKVGGTSGIVLYVRLPQAESIEEYVANVLGMLHVLGGSRPGLPLLLVHSRELEDNHLAAWISLRRALEDCCQQSGLCFSGVQCLKLDIPNFVPQSQIPEEKSMCSSLCWLVEHSPPPPSLHHTSLGDFLEKGLLDLFTPLVVSDSTARHKAGLPSQSPSPIVSLYNHILNHLAMLATSEDLQKLDWPAPEFARAKFASKNPPPVFWNSPSYLSELKQCILRLQLPSAPLPGPDWSKDEWSTQCLQCINYVASIGSPQSSVILISRVKALLHHHHHSNDTDQSKDCVPWSQVILICIEHILSCLDSELWASSLDDSKHKFILPTNWLKAQAETSLARASQLTESPKRKRHRSDPPHLMATPLTSHYYSGSPKLRDVSSSVGVSPYGQAVGGATIKESELTQKLLALIEREKVQSRRFEAQLKEWLNSPSVSSLSPASDQTPPTSPDSLVPQTTSLSKRLEKLQTEIRAAKWKDKEFNTYLRTVSRM